MRIDKRITQVDNFLGSVMMRDHIRFSNSSKENVQVFCSNQNTRAFFVELIKFQLSDPKKNVMAGPHSIMVEIQFLDKINTFDEFFQWFDKELVKHNFTLKKETQLKENEMLWEYSRKNFI